MRKHLENSRKLFWPGLLCLLLAVIAAVQVLFQAPEDIQTYVILYGACFFTGDVLLFLALWQYQKYVWYRDYKLAQLKS